MKGELLDALSMLATTKRRCSFSRCDLTPRMFITDLVLTSVLILLFFR